MLPAVIAKQLKRGLCDYIETTFPMTNPYFKGTIQRMLSTEGSVFHDSYVSVRLPFRVAEEESLPFEAVHPKFKPYLHQQKAFERLTGEDGRSTIIATGTGSGKTECFQYPILEYCYKHRGEAGIKALIVYPMNALATDQAKRFAELIYNSPELKGKVTAGMYVGGRDEHPSRMMTEHSLITDKDTMLMTPPDILLTNYKMLDYLLVRPKDAELWRDNDPDTLKYIAVDEMHTFDGAQGTDLACLLRRLKSRLFTQHGFLCCIGTSATMGSESSTDSIKAYAESIFGEDFESDSVITEDRLTADEFLEGFEPNDFTVPDKRVIESLSKAIEKNEMNEYLKMAVGAWFVDADYDDIMSDEARLELANRLMRHDFTQNIIKLMKGNYTSMDWLQQELEIKYPAIKEISNTDVLFDALFSIISHARNSAAGKVRPFLTVSVQLWMRELRRVLAKVSQDEIDYALAADLNEEQAKYYLPVINCRDCGETGWVGIMNERGNVKMSDLKVFYNLFFNKDENIRMLFPTDDAHVFSGMASARLCPECMQIELGDAAQEICTSCGKETIPVMIPKNPVQGNGENQHYVCPFCGSEHGLTLVGLRSTTAISAETSQLYSSKFNDDKKLLAFSDNVQDAAHRAGFFNSRTWKFGLRRSIQKFALEKGNGLSITDFQSGFIKYWHENMSNEEFVSYFIPPNMTWKISYENMIKNGKLEQSPLSKKLIDDIEKRIKYEIMLEY